MRQIELVEEKKPAGQQTCGYQYWQDNAVNADAGGFDGDDFVGALH